MNGELFTWIAVGFIIGASVYYLLKLKFKYKDGEKLAADRRNVEYIPTVVSTLGVLGTFVGIAIGLWKFNPSDLDQSIPGLLGGLKTAFFTSIAGMLGSMFLSWRINLKQDKKDGGISDINQAAGEITKSVKAMSDANIETIRSIQKQLAGQEADRKAFYRTAGEVMSKMSETQKTTASDIGSLVVLQRSQENSLSAVAEYSQKIEGGIEAAVDRMTGIIHCEASGIGDKMTETNGLLERKFGEFAELLKKSNTEALVEVMKKVTEEFQKQMNTLINKLVQENFDQLNKSVEKLNRWQQENKEMIASLTRQYKEMSDNFEAASSSLSRVKDDTAALVSEGGKLRQLVDALNQVVVEDKRFIEITKELRETASLTKSNMESFDESTKALNEWVRKQRKFTDGVQQLIGKLEELDKIRDYGEQFWKGTKDKMEEGVGIIARGSQTLNSQLKELDSEFYNRLSATLGELDRCIAGMAEHYTKDGAR